MVLVGIVVGSLLANVTASVPALGWLSYALSFGLETPLVLDLLYQSFGLKLLHVLERHSLYFFLPISLFHFKNSLSLLL